MGGFQKLQSDLQTTSTLTTKVSRGYIHITYAYMPCFTESTHQTSKSVPFYAPLRTLYPPFFRISFASESCSCPPCIVRFWSRLEVIAVAQWKRGWWQGNLIETTFLTSGHRCDGVHTPNGDKDAELIVDHLHCRSLKHWSCTIKILEIWVPEALHQGCTNFKNCSNSTTKWRVLSNSPGATLAAERVLS